MKLWQQNEEEEKDDWPEDMARKLANGLLKKKVLTRMPRLRRWIRAFKDLVRIDKVDKEEIAQVLAWYLKHIGEDYIPSARSGHAFRAKWSQIKAQKDRSMEVVKASDEAQVVYDAIKTRRWPGGVDAYLLGIVQKSFDAYNKFWSRVADYKEDTPEARLLAHLKAIRFLASPKQFILSWMDFIHADMVGRESWLLDPRQLAWSLNNSKFERLAYHHTFNYCANSSQWNKLLVEIGANK